MVQARPVALGGVAGASEEQDSVPIIAAAQNLGQCRMDRAAAFAIAPAWHDDRTRDDIGSLVTGPADGVQEGLRALRFPVREEQFSLRRQRMDYFAAKDAMLTISGFEIAVAAKRSSLDPLRKRFPQLLLVTPETRVENGDLDAPAEQAGFVPGFYTDPGQVFRTLPNRNRAPRRNGFVGA